MITTTDIEAFAADRRGFMAEAEASLLGSVKRALRHFTTGDDGWRTPLVNRALRLMRREFRSLSGRTSTAELRMAVTQFRAVLEDTLDALEEVTDIEVQAQAIAASISTAALNIAREAAANSDEHRADLVKVWITMLDEKVRPHHAAAHGQRVALGERFHVGTSLMMRPGDLRAPVGEWINCRCILAIELSTTTAAADLARLAMSEGDPMTITAADAANVDLTDGMNPIPWHGVLAPEGVVSGDGRKFAADSIVWRDLPLPLSWQKVNASGHDGSVIVGRIDNIWRDGGLVKANGVMLDTPEADEVVGMMAEGGLRGVSIDGDKATMQYEMHDGRLVEDVMDTLSEGEGIDLDQVIQNFTSLRVSGATLCAIPAFQEAYVSLGTEDAAPPVAASGTTLTFTTGQFIATPIGATTTTGATFTGTITDATFTVTEAEDDGEAFRDVPTAERKRLAGEGKAMPDGSYPIANCEDLGNAIRAIGRAKNPNAVKRHIAKRKSALGCPDIELPWSLEDVDEVEFEETDEFVKTEDGPGWLTHPVDTERLRRYWTKGAGAAKIRWGIPGDFNRCRRQLAKYVKPQYLSGYCANRHYDALGFWPGRPVSADTVAFDGESVHLVASAEPDFVPPKSWFEDPNLVGESPIVVTEDGRVFGHLATWGTCHIGFGGTCVQPPTSHTAYAYFRTGSVRTDDGEVAVGHLTMDTGHAATGLGARPATAHYDNTGLVVADVAAGEDTYGIWVSGAIRPGLAPEKVTALRAAALSGDWREIGGHLELVAALVVNVPGFPIPRLAVAASLGRQTALVASGIVRRPEGLTPATVEQIVQRAIERHEAMVGFKALAAKAKVRQAAARKEKMAALAAARGRN